MTKNLPICLGHFCCPGSPALRKDFFPVRAPAQGSRFVVRALPFPGNSFHGERRIFSRKHVNFNLWPALDSNSQVLGNTRVSTVQLLQLLWLCMSTVYCNGNQILDLKGFKSISVANGFLDPRFTLPLTMASSITLRAETSVLPTRNGGRGCLTRPHLGLSLTWLAAESPLINRGRGRG